MDSELDLASSSQRAPQQSSNPSSSSSAPKRHLTDDPFISDSNPNIVSDSSSNFDIDKSWPRKFRSRYAKNRVSRPVTRTPADGIDSEDDDDGTDASLPPLVEEGKQKASTGNASTSARNNRVTITGSQSAPYELSSDSDSPASHAFPKALGTLGSVSRARRAIAPQAGSKDAPYELSDDDGQETLNTAVPRTQAVTPSANVLAFRPQHPTNNLKALRNTSRVITKSSYSLCHLSPKS